MKFDLMTVGHWSLIGGLVITVLASLMVIPNLTLILFGLGIIVGFLNVNDKGSSSFLIAVIALLIIGVAGLQLGELTDLVSEVLQNFITFMAAAALIVAVKQVLSVAKIK